MDSPKIFNDEADLTGDIFTDLDDDESVENFADFEIKIDE